MSALVSVLLATNSPRYLEQAIRSLTAQTLEKWELIIVDDCSPVPITAAWGRDARIRVVRNSGNLGLAASLSRALELAQGCYIARMDVDDICYPRRFEKQYEALKNTPNMDVVGCHALMFRGVGVPLGLLRPPTEHKEIIRHRLRGSFPLLHPTWMGRRHWFAKFPYDAAFKKAQDYELLLRSAESSRFMNLPEVLLGYRYERGSLGKRLQSRKYVLKALNKQLAGQGRWRDYAQGASCTFAKAVADVVVEGIGIQRIRERAVLDEVPEDELRRWQKVWRAVNCA